MKDLVAGQIDMMIDQVLTCLAQVRDGQIKAYAVTAKSRLAVAPNIPTVDEAGLPGFYVSNWNALWAPKGTPRTIIAKLNAAAEAERKTLEEQLAHKLAAAEKTIASTREAAMSNVRGIAAEAAAAIVQRLTGLLPDGKSVDSAVDASLKG